MKRRPGRIVLVLILVWVAFYFLVAHPRLVQWGSTAAERARVFPGDELTPDASRQGTRAITIDAPPDKVWPWLMQLGIGRSGFYSYTWLENLFLAGIHNEFRPLPDLRVSRAGEFVRSVQFGAESPGKNGWTMEPFKAGKYFYLSPGWGPFVVEPNARGGTRFIVRTRRGSLPAPVNILLDFVFDPLHGAMEKRMMHSVKALAEGRRPFSRFWTAVATLGFLAAALFVTGAVLSRPRRKAWIALPLVYAVLVAVTTTDLRAVLVGEVALGAVVAFFLFRGRRAWAYLALFWIYAFAVLVWAKDAYIVFGLTLFIPLLGLVQGRTDTEERP
jgi:hypothetical protein